MKNTFSWWRKPHMWTREEGAKVAASIETIAMPLGFHVAMGGSVLHRGWGDKDLDIYLYDRSNTHQQSVNEVIKQLKQLKIDQDETCNSTSISGDRYVYRCWWNKKRIDIFFLVKLSDEVNQYSHP